MNIHHVFSLAPHLAQGGDYRNYHNSTTEKLVQIISIAAWKRHHPNAQAIIYADTAAAKWLKINRLEALYDKIDTQALDAMPPNIHHPVFWAAGKIYAYQDALRHETAPIFMDTDAILWENLNHLNLTGDIVTAHWESFPIFEGFSAHHLHVPNGYRFPIWASILQKTPLQQLNASFIWFKNADLADRYLFESKRFMEKNRATNAAHLPNWVYMCFAEQVLLADTARFLNKKIETLGVSQSDALNAIYSHLWGLKNTIRQNKNYANALLNKCLERIEHDYKDYQALSALVIQSN